MTLPDVGKLLNLGVESCHSSTILLKKHQENDIELGVSIRADVINLEYNTLNELFDVIFDEADRIRLKNALKSLIFKYKEITGITINEISSCHLIDETFPTFFSENLIRLTNLLESVVRDLNLYGKDGKMRVFVNETNEIITPNKNITIRRLPYVFCIAYLRNYRNKVNWKNSSNKVIYLPGKLFKFERLLLIRKMLENPNLKNKFVFSCRPKIFDSYSTETLTLQKEMIEYDPKWNDLKGWISPHAKELDLSNEFIGPKFHDDWDLMSKFPVDLMNDKILQLVTETWYCCPNFLTEKVFNPLITGMPFIILNDHFLPYLHDLGFKSYQEIIEPMTLGYQEKSLDVNIMVKRVEKFVGLCRVSHNFVIQVKKIIQHNIDNSHRLMLEYLTEFDRYLYMVMLNRYDRNVGKFHIEVDYG